MSKTDISRSPAEKPPGSLEVEPIAASILEPIVRKANAAAANAAPSVSAYHPPDINFLPPQPRPMKSPSTDPNYWGKLAGEIEPIVQQPNPADELQDVIVIGGGLSGLTTAYRVLEGASSQLQLKPKVIVLESAAKLGGRTRSADPWPELIQVDKNAPHVSYGGTWVMLDNHDLLSLSWDLDHLPFEPTVYPNFNTFALNWTLLVTHPYLIIKLRTLGSKIWNAKTGSADDLALRKYDTISIEQWMQEEAKDLPFPEHAKQAVRDWCFSAENFPQRPEHLWFMSTWYLSRTIYQRLSHVAQTGIFLAKIMRWENGTGEIVTRLIDKVRKLGGYCYTEQRVTGFVTKDGIVEVSLTVGPDSKPAVYRAKRVVIATAPHPMSKLDYKPDPLPQSYIDFAHSLRQWDDTGTQVVLCWKTRWWDKEKMSVVLLPPPDDEEMGVFGATMDLSDHGAHSISKYHQENEHPLPDGVGVLRILVKSIRLKNPDGSMWDNDRIRQSAFDYLVKYAKLKKRSSDMQKDFLKCWVWNHEWNPDTLSTAFFGQPTGEHAANFDKCSDPWGLFHFAGSERSPRGVQWMEGAVYMGNVKAPEVLQALYPDKWREDVEKVEFKKKLAESEKLAIALLRSSHMEHPVRYLFQMIGRLAVGLLKNAFRWIKEYNELEWTAPPPKLPQGAKFEIVTVIGSPNKGVIGEDVKDAIYSPEGKFRIIVTKEGVAELQHLKVRPCGTSIVNLDEHPKVVVVFNTLHVAGKSPYRLELQPTGDLQFIGNDGQIIWHTETVCPEGLYAKFSFGVGDARGVNVYGYRNTVEGQNPERQVIWSLGSFEPHFAKASLRLERHEFHSSLGEFEAELNLHQHRRYRRPKAGTVEEQIETEMYQQQHKEKEYGRIFANVSEVTDQPDRLQQGASIAEGATLLSPHGTYKMSVVKGDIILQHRRHGVHPLHPWTDIWAASTSKNPDAPVWKGKGPVTDARLELTVRGELKLHHGNEVVWETPAPAKHRPHYRLHVQDDGNIGVYDSHLKPIWTAGTGREADLNE